MRPIPPTPTGTSLPMPAARVRHRRRHAGEVELTADAIERFNVLLHELHPDAPHVDADAIASVARWLRAQPEDERDGLLRQRLARLDELQQMREDRDWPMESGQARRIDRLLAYVAGSDDLFPDQLPVIGRLDDALLVELVWPMLSEDLEDYRDFCRYREETRASGRRRPVTQVEWMNARLEEGALWEQMHRVHDRHYADYFPPEPGFRVS